MFNIVSDQCCRVLHVPESVVEYFHIKYLTFYVDGWIATFFVRQDLI